jgi:hypothetical protein
MTPDQFTGLATLMQMRASPAQEAARLMLVDDINQAEAARRTGPSLQAASQAGGARSQGDDAGADRKRLTPKALDIGKHPTNHPTGKKKAPRPLDLSA